MDRVVDAIHEKGILKLLATLALPEHQRVRVTTHDATEASPDERLDA
jgi:predicted DNA-binding antitoxin AbrB/MazE fold protein